jgi:hypothetical protein
MASVNFPRTKVENLSLSRMIIGTNWFFGWSHTSKAKDDYIKANLTTPKIAAIIEVFLAAGVDTIMGQIQHPGMKEAIDEAQQRTGKKLIVISTPTLSIVDSAAALGESERAIEKDAKMGAAFCLPHMVCTDKLLDHQNRRFFPLMEKYCKMIRQRGMVPGLSTHLPESIVYADESGLDVATYISIYNAAGFLMHLEADWTLKIIRNAKKPVTTIKPMAAGRLLPLVGLGFAWGTVRDQDMVTVGTMTPDEARELVELSLSLLERRPAQVELQRTRSKETVNPRPPASA